MSFVNPLFLIGLSAALLPVLYHLIRRMQAKKVPFGSLLFLKATPKQIVRKRRLRDLLLMATRAAMFALLAVVFARPFFPEERLPFVSGRQDQSVVLLVDNSYSMQYEDLFEQARQEVLRRIGAGGPDDEFAVIAFSNQARQLTELTTDRSLLTGTVQSALEVSNRPTDYYRPLRLAEEVLQDARHSNRSIVLISDFQRSGWSGALDNWKLSPDIELVPVKLTEGEPGNAYLEAVELTQQRAGNVGGVRLDARVSAHGENAERPNTASFLLDGSTVDRRELEPLPSSRVTFQRQTDQEGFVQGEIALSEDDLEIDNRFYFTYTVSGKPSILSIDGAASGTSRDAFYLGSAYDLGEEGLYTFSSGAPQRITRSELRPHGMVFVSNVPSLAPSQIAALKEYVELGGGLVVSFGEQTDLPSFSSVLQELGVGRIQTPVRDSRTAPVIIGEVDLRHPVFNLFANAGMTVILRPAFRQYVEVMPDTAATVIGRYDTGDPFLIERALGQGKVLVYTSTFNTDWTDFPIQEMYVPFVYQLAKYALGNASDGALYTVGESVVLRGRPGAEWEVRAPGNRLIRVTNNESGEGFFRETEEPGHYTAASAGERVSFSVNVDPVEANLEARDAEEAYAAIVDQAGARGVLQAGAVDATEAEDDQKLWKYILLAIVALFMLETFLANRRIPVFKTKPLSSPARIRHQQPV